MRRGLIAVAVAVGLVTAVACAPAGLRGLRDLDGGLVVSPSGRTPVLFVPGWALECRQGPATEWQRWIDALEADGWARGEVEVVDYDACAPAAESAERVAAAVGVLRARTGAPRVTLIAHSMGAIAARWCVVKGECAGQVGTVVTLAGANHGTAWAALCDLQYWSAACDDMNRDGPTLVELNSGDETPPPTRWVAWVSICELGIFPRQNALLNGAENHDLVDRCIWHDDWKRDQWAITTIVGDLARAG